MAFDLDIWSAMVHSDPTKVTFKGQGQNSRSQNESCSFFAADASYKVTYF